MRDCLLHALKPHRLGSICCQRSRRRRRPTHRRKCIAFYFGNITVHRPLHGSTTQCQFCRWKCECKRGKQGGKCNLGGKATWAKVQSHLRPKQLLQLRTTRSTLSGELFGWGRDSKSSRDILHKIYTPGCQVCRACVCVHYSGTNPCTDWGKPIPKRKGRTPDGTTSAFQVTISADMQRFLSHPLLVVYPREKFKGSGCFVH